VIFILYQPICIGNVIQVTSIVACRLQQLVLTTFSTTDEIANINRRLPKELLLRHVNC